MLTRNAHSVAQDSGGTPMVSDSNGYAVSTPPARAMSHNRRTLQDVRAWPACTASERRLTQKNGGPA
jgi:hypothetical protein